MRENGTDSVREIGSELMMDATTGHFVRPTRCNRTRRDGMHRASAIQRLVFIALFASAGVAADAQTNAPATPSSAAPSAPLIVISGWRLECASTTGGSLACEALDRVSVRTTGAVVGGLSVHFLADGKTPEILVQVPLGIAVPAGVRVGTNSGIMQTLPVSTCNRDGCFARAQMSGPLLGAMRAAKEALRIAYDSLAPNADARTVTISLGLDGFAAAYDKLH